MPTKAPPVGKGFDINRQLGPLPLWGWGAVAVGGWFVYTHFVKPAGSAGDGTGGAVPGLSYGQNMAPSDGGTGGGGGGSGGDQGDQGDKDKHPKPPHHKGSGGNIHNVIPPVGSKPPSSPKHARVGRSKVSTFSAVNKGSAGGAGAGFSQAYQAKATKQRISRKRAPAGFHPTRSTTVYQAPPPRRGAGNYRPPPRAGSHHKVAF